MHKNPFSGKSSTGPFGNNYCHCYAYAFVGRWSSSGKGVNWSWHLSRKKRLAASLPTSNIRYSSTFHTALAPKRPHLGRPRSSRSRCCASQPVSWLASASYIRSLGSFVLTNGSAVRQPPSIPGACLVGPPAPGIASRDMQTFKCNQCMGQLLNHQ